MAKNTAPKSTRTTRKPAPSPEPRQAPTRDAPASDGADHEATARRAYEIYQSRGASHGSDVDDWLRAEREIKARRQADR